ncbi:MAG: hypothetical protein K6E29_03165 [Cyanobacteria bacterium RUI128]|nr:hypothetical protein [Cyanobacteria bacterium RUI128]
MGMSASQARLLSLTARMHDLEFQAQGIQYSKLDLVDSKQAEYDKYLEALDSTKFQMAVVTGTGKEYHDITYTNMISANVGGGIHSMYIITDSAGRIFLPEQITSKIGGETANIDPIKSSINPLKADGTEKTVDEKLEEYIVKVARNRVYQNGVDKNGNTLSSDADYVNAMKADGNYSYWKSQYFSDFPDEQDFMLAVAKNYLYSNRLDLSENEDFINEMRNDGNYSYWKGVYRQIAGYTEDDGNIVKGRGYSIISRENAVDRGWLEKALNSGEAQLYKMTREESFFDNGDKVNIFAETSLSVDPDLAEVSNEELIAQASVEYERAIKDIDGKETKLDLQLARIDQQHNALKTEYDSVKQIVSKNIDRSFKTFNA